MIYSAAIKTGFAANLTTLQDRLFHFTEGLNVIVGPAGSGKTTLLRIIGAYTCCWHKDYGGWSRHPKEPSNLNGKYVFPAALRRLCIGECGANVAWDGVPVMYHESGKSDDYSSFFYGTDIEDSPDGLNSGTEQQQLRMANPSAGQLRTYKITKLREKWRQQPDLTVPVPHPTNFDRAFNEYIKKLPRDGCATILMDEPDRSLSFSDQLKLWAVILPHWAAEGQIITSSHSIVPVLMAKQLGANIIDLTQGFSNRVAAECMALMADFCKSHKVSVDSQDPELQEEAESVTVC